MLSISKPLSGATWIPAGLSIYKPGPEASSSPSSAESRPGHGVCKCSRQWSLMEPPIARGVVVRRHNRAPPPKHPRRPLEESGRLCAEAESGAVEAGSCTTRIKTSTFRLSLPHAPLPSWQRVSFDHAKPLLFYISIEYLTQSLRFCGGIVVACCLL